MMRLKQTIELFLNLGEFIFFDLQLLTDITVLLSHQIEFSFTVVQTRL